VYFLTLPHYSRSRKIFDELESEFPEFSKGNFSSFSEEEKELVKRIIFRGFYKRVNVYKD
jgi:hypothetical protein